LPEIPPLGRRGEGWVVLQAVLIAALVALCAVGPRWPDGVQVPLAVVGTLLALVAVTLVAWSSRLLGKGLTPLPRPVREGALVETGPYRVVRHPIYSGLLVLASGLSLAFSPLALVPTALLAVLFALKAAVEERFLSEAYPAYEAYAERTRSRLVQFVF
jgi:protein-S-isoprenylcysteine O-methyltransferase Ste14